MEKELAKEVQGKNRKASVAAETAVQQSMSKK